ncbi:hypothetical protein F4820DRAFT_90961 [Hypoxylon rubiginosum]|uniref:Uncharacterized protein n=1 Tax=Hypoxylon rubiginosum TaxID=110542 RepID=A0ACB9ZDJ1_9PEZI|nr:hypothetical protein F4820DRAFT_90961 [Hypoxylon rubiginosum]
MRSPNVHYRPRAPILAIGIVFLIVRLIDGRWGWKHGYGLKKPNKGKRKDKKKNRRSKNFRGKCLPLAKTPLGSHRRSAAIASSYTKGKGGREKKKGKPPTARQFLAWDIFHDNSVLQSMHASIEIHDQNGGM